MKQIQMRLGNLELRLVGTSKSIPYFEVIEWFGDKPNFCHTIAYWQPDNEEGFDLKFVGSRPLRDTVNKDDFWELVKMGQKLSDDNKEELNYE